MQISIRQIRAQNAGEEIVLAVYLSDGEHEERRELILTTGQYAELKPAKGEISEAFFERLESAAQLTAAIKRGSYILGYGSNSRRTLVQKLKRRGFTADQSEAAAEYLESHHCINEAADAAREAENCLRKLWGRRRIIEHLRSRGYDAESLNSLEDVFDKVNFAANCRTLVCKRYGIVPNDRKQLQKLYAALMRYGYSMSEIRAACACEETDFPED